MKITTISCGLLETNCYILDNGTDAVMFDPDGEWEEISPYLQDLNLRAVILTHGHFDHIGGVDIICEKTGAKLYINAEDEEMLTDTKKNASHLLPNYNVVCNTTPLLFEGGAVLCFGDIIIKTLHTPGHTKGSTCFICEDIMISGDTLFKNGMGRTDLYGGNISELFSSLRKLFALDINYNVYPGHGPKTTLNKEKRGIV